MLLFIKYVNCLPLFYKQWISLLGSQPTSDFSESWHIHTPIIYFNKVTRWWSPDHRNQQPNPMTSRTRLRDVVLLMRYSSWAINRQEEEKKKKWPIIMLIGDYHRSVMCTWRHRSRLLVTMIMPFVSSHLVISIGVGIHRRFLQELLRQCYAGNNWFAIYHSQEVPVNGILEKNNWITIIISSL